VGIILMIRQNRLAACSTQKRILLMIELVREEICAVVERSEVNWSTLKHFGWGR
jgi:hypothetical protein